MAMSDAPYVDTGTVVFGCFSIAIVATIVSFVAVGFDMHAAAAGCYAAVVVCLFVALAVV